MIVGRFCLQILFGRVGIRSTFLCQCCEVTSLPQTTEIKIEKGRNDTKAAEKLRKANTLTDSSGLWIWFIIGKPPTGNAGLKRSAITDQRVTTYYTCTHITNAYLKRRRY